jgi:hypothetical protein
MLRWKLLDKPIDRMQTKKRSSRNESLELVIYDYEKEKTHHHLFQPCGKKGRGKKKKNISSLPTK